MFYLFSHSVVLYPVVNSVTIDSTLVLLECILAGETSNNHSIQWSFNGHLLRSSDKYRVFTGDSFECTYGKCHQSQLQIRQATTNDAGIYTCSFQDMLKNITVTDSTSKFSP